MVPRPLRIETHVFRRLKTELYNIKGCSTIESNHWFMSMRNIQKAHDPANK